MSSSILGVLELSLEGEINKKNGDFEKMEQEKLEKFSEKFYYILQDVQELRKQKENLGNFRKITIKSGSYRYEAAVGDRSIKIYKLFKANE